ncbi:MAG: 50S ribosomal protein L2 [Candidatus Hadarchaeum sp.]|uniref:50S ribosomal protein L2 n=1 Tax=Candidatus Hadarchaeum sp. TaxID=2883567 RepID=UPI00316E45C4
MGKRLRAQRIGDGSPTYRAKSWRRLGKIELPSPQKTGEAVVVDILHDRGRNAPVAMIRCEDGQEHLMLAPEGLKVGDRIMIGTAGEAKPGNVLTLSEIPEGTPVFNIETKPGDGGKLVRAAGSYAVVIGHEGDRVSVQLPSGEIKEMDPRCRATVGVVAGGGRLEKPLVKAGKRHHIMIAKGKHYPRTRAVAMNVVDHPFGGGRGKNAGRPKTVARGAPPGQKVGLIAARRTGKR